MVEALIQFLEQYQHTFTSSDLGNLLFCCFCLHNNYTSLLIPVDCSVFKNSSKTSSNLGYFLYGSTT